MTVLEAVGSNREADLSLSILDAAYVEEDTGLAGLDGVGLVST